MRGSDQRAGSLFSYVDLEARGPSGHPLRVIRGIVNEVLGGCRGSSRGCTHGWAALGTAGRVVGHIFIHNGDDSGFVAERADFCSSLLEKSAATIHGRTRTPFRLPGVKINGKRDPAL